MKNKVAALVPFDPKDYPDATCCGVLEHLRRCGFDTIYRPIRLLGDKTLESRGWAVRLYDEAQKAKTRSVPAYLSYCPFCGNELGAPK